MDSRTLKMAKVFDFERSGWSQWLPGWKRRIQKRRRECWGMKSKGKRWLSINPLRNFDIVVNHVPETRPKYMW
jgi:hypothetical protein